MVITIILPYQWIYSTDKDISLYCVNLLIIITIILAYTDFWALSVVSSYEVIFAILHVYIYIYMFSMIYIFWNAETKHKSPYVGGDLSISFQLQCNFIHIYTCMSLSLSLSLYIYIYIYIGLATGYDIS